MSTNDTDANESIEPRTKRAVTECMTVLPEGGDVYTVIGENGGGEYAVDAREGRCTCPDSTYNLGPSERCKHSRRVAIVRGERPVPSVAPSNVDPLLGAHVAREDTPATDAAPTRAVTDGGLIVAEDDGENLDEGESCECKACAALPDGFPCWECYRDGVAKLPVS